MEFKFCVLLLVTFLLGCALSLPFSTTSEYLEYQSENVQLVFKSKSFHPHELDRALMEYSKDVFPVNSKSDSIYTRSRAFFDLGGAFLKNGSPHIAVSLLKEMWRILNEEEDELIQEIGEVPKSIEIQVLNWLFMSLAYSSEFPAEYKSRKVWLYSDVRRGGKESILENARCVHLNSVQTLQVLDKLRSFQTEEEEKMQWPIYLVNSCLTDAHHRFCPFKYAPIESSLEMEFVYEIGDTKLDLFSNGGAVLLEDLNGDGFIDILTGGTCFDCRLEVLYSTGETLFNATSFAGFEGQIGGAEITQTDYNNDGYLDVYIQRGTLRPTFEQRNLDIDPKEGTTAFGTQVSSLFRNNGDGTFTDTTFEALGQFLISSRTSTWTDLNNDGWVDLIICGERMEKVMFFINLGNGRFFDAAEQIIVDSKLLSMLQVAYLSGLGVGDYDGDAFPDLFFSVHDPQRSPVLHNLGKSGLKPLLHDEIGLNILIPTFEQVEEVFWMEMEDFFGGLPLVFDINNDGFDDVIYLPAFMSITNSPSKFVFSEFVRYSLDRMAQPRVFFGNELGLVEKSTLKIKEYALLANTATLADFDMDGFLDIYVGLVGYQPSDRYLPNRLLHNSNGEDFEDFSGRTGTGFLCSTYGSAAADLDNDGDPDLYLNNGGMFTGDMFWDMYLRNPKNSKAEGATANWIGVRLEGLGRTGCNRAAFGAKIAVHCSDDNGNSRVIWRRVSPGGAQGSNPLLQTIGVGTCTTIDQVIILWPSREGYQMDFVRDLSINQSYRIIEGTSTATPILLGQRYHPKDVFIDP